jgi:hypothetical protein
MLEALPRFRASSTSIDVVCYPTPSLLVRSCVCCVLSDTTSSSRSACRVPLDAMAVEAVVSV